MLWSHFQGAVGSCLGIPETILSFTGLLEGLTELSKAVTLSTTVITAKGHRLKSAEVPGRAQKIPSGSC